jgi:hypothetical protein
MTPETIGAAIDACELPDEERGETSTAALPQTPPNGLHAYSC